MSAMERRRAAFYYALVVIYFATGYLGINAFTTTRAHVYEIGTALDTAIPFLPAWVWGYILIYPALIGVLFVVPSYPTFQTAIRQYLILITLHFMIFLIFPVRYPRPDFISDGSITGWLLQLTYAADYPNNCFPSLHVSLPLIGGLILWKERRSWSIVYLVATLIISVSTLMIKQHYLWDVVAAWGVTLILSKMRLVKAHLD